MPGRHEKALRACAGRGRRRGAGEMLKQGVQGRGITRENTHFSLRVSRLNNSCEVLESKRRECILLR